MNTDFGSIISRPQSQMTALKFVPNRNVAIPVGEEAAPLHQGEAPASISQKAIGVWHGSDKQIEEFLPEKMGTGLGDSWFGPGFYVSSSRDVAKYFARFKKILGGGYVHRTQIVVDPEALIDLRKPFSQQSTQVRRALIEIGHPGVDGEILDRAGIVGDGREPIIAQLRQLGLMNGMRATNKVPLETQIATMRKLQELGIQGIVYSGHETADMNALHYIIYDPSRIWIQEGQKLGLSPRGWAVLAAPIATGGGIAAGVAAARKH